MWKKVCKYCWKVYDCEEGSKGLIIHCENFEPFKDDNEEKYWIYDKRKK